MTRSYLVLDQATPGMCLGEDVRDGQGALLLAAGVLLTEHQLDVLERRGIQQVCVEVAEVLTEEERAARREAVRARLVHLFRGAQTGEADRQLFECVLAYRLGQLK